MPVLDVQDLYRRYGTVEALRGITFSVDRGEVVGLLGPNGAGKSTTLRVLAGWLAPTAGRVRVAGVDVLLDPVGARRHLGYLPEGAPLPDEQTVAGALQFAAAARGMGQAERTHAIGTTAERVGITGHLGQRIETLSRGYRQRVGLASAILHDPPIVVLDEPTTGLDPNQIADIRSLIRQIGQTRTVLLSTHVLSEVEATCDRVLILHQGRLVADDTPAQITARSTGRVVRVALGPSKVTTGTDRVLAELGDLPGVHNVLAVAPEAGEVLRVAVYADTDVRAEVFHWAAAHGQVLLELSSERQDLQHVFHQLTQDPAEVT